MIGKFLLIFLIIVIVLIMFNVRIFGVDFFVDRTYDLMDLTGHQHQRSSA